MKLHQLFEGKHPQEWRFDKREGDAVLFTDYGRGMEYSAVFVYDREDYFEFYSQKVSYHGDSISWGGSENTKRKKLNTVADLQKFLVSQGYPEVPADILKQMDDAGEHSAGIPDSYGSTKRFKFDKDSMLALREKSKTYEDFELGILMAIKKEIKKRDWMYFPKELSEATKRVLKKFYDSGTWPRKT